MCETDFDDLFEAIPDEDDEDLFDLIDEFDLPEDDLDGIFDE